MIEPIKNIFGSSVTERRFRIPDSMPNYIRYGFDISLLSFMEKSCLLVRPKNDGWNLATLKKQMKVIENICKKPVVAQLDRLTALQRTNLIESHIAFVSGKGQVFIPFWGCLFEEKIVNPQEPVSTLSANAQLVLLFLFYKKETEFLNQTQIAAALGMPKATCARAVQQLKSLGIVSSISEGTANFITVGTGKIDINAAFPHITSPVQKLVYVKSLPENLRYKISGFKALSERTNLVPLSSDGGYAVSRDVANTLKKELVIDEETFRDFGGEIIEVWKYDPFLLSDSEYVDDISLLLELNDSDDERVQNELDNIRQKYGLKGGAE